MVCFAEGGESSLRLARQPAGMRPVALKSMQGIAMSRNRLKREEVSRSQSQRVRAVLRTPIVIRGTKRTRARTQTHQESLSCL